MSNKNTTIMPSTPKRTSIFAPFLNALRGLDAADPPVRPAPAHATMNEGTPPTEDKTRAATRELRSGVRRSFSDLIGPMPAAAIKHHKPKDEAFDAAVASGSLPTFGCFRCKIPGCLGVVHCKFDSNVFIGKKNVSCFCGQGTKGQLVTMMQRGPWAGKSAHQLCASRWYDENPAAAKGEDLKFALPPPEVKAFLDDFIAGIVKHSHLNAVQGSGKSNNLVYCISEFRRMAALKKAVGEEFRYKVLVFGVKAREELLSRGVRADEISTFHAYGHRLYKQWAIANMNETTILANDHETVPKVEPTVCPVKTRLLVSNYFKDQPSAQALTALFRMFVNDLVNISQALGFGQPDGPSSYDEEALADIANKYGIVDKLASAWTTSLSHPQRTALAALGLHEPEMRITLGVQVTSHILELTYQFATELNVDGVTALYNEVKEERFPNPTASHREQVCLAGMLELGGQLDRLLADETNDLTKDAMNLLRNATTPDGSMLTVGDDGQIVFQWMGVERKSIMEFRSSAHTLNISLNRRSGRLINQEAQVYLDKLGLGVVLETARDFDGKVVHDCTFHSHPINSSASTLVLGRFVRYVVIFYLCLLAKGYAVSMHGGKDTVTVLTAIFAQMPIGTVQERRDVLAAELAMAAPSAEDEEYDLKSALMISMDAFLEGAPDQSKAADFLAWMQAYFKPSADSYEGEIRCSTYHRAKGNEAKDGYIIQPSSTPLPERVAKGGWEEDEENCLAYMIRGRAADNLYYLKNLDRITRTTVMGLFEGEDKVDISIPQSQDDSFVDTETTATSETTEPPVDDEHVKNAMELLGMTVMPTSASEVNAHVRKSLPPRSAGTAIASGGDEKRKRVLAARAVIIANLKA